MTDSPIAKTLEQRTKSFAVGSQLILGAKNGLTIKGALHDAGVFELAEMLDENLVRSLRNPAAQLTKPKLAILQFVKDEGLPFASDDAESERDRTLRQQHRQLFHHMTQDSDYAHSCA